MGGERSHTPPMREKSNPYWNEAVAIREQIRIDFLFSHRVVFVRSLLTEVMIPVDVANRSKLTWVLFNTLHAPSRG